LRSEKERSSVTQSARTMALGQPLDPFRMRYTAHNQHDALYIRRAPFLLQGTEPSHCSDARQLAVVTLLSGSETRPRYPGGQWSAPLCRFERKLADTSRYFVKLGNEAMLGRLFLGRGRPSSAMTERGFWDRRNDGSEPADQGPRTNVCRPRNDRRNDISAGDTRLTGTRQARH
jgi:hypothetical protein